MASPARLRTVLLALAALLAALLVTPGPAAHSAERERVYGAINCPRQAECPNIKVLWFDEDWTYIDQGRANGGGYALRLAPGTYHLQFVDQRPAWDTSKYAPTDVTVTVRQHTVSKTVTMRPGASITGVARAAGKPLRGARVVAANQAEQSFATTANKKGQFAIGGLPAGKYCLFTFDRARRHVDKCTWVGGVDFGQSKNRAVSLRKKAGSLTVFVETREGRPAPNSTVTVTSRKTGQWWSSKVRSGKAVFNGLFPGRYRIKYDGAGVWFTATGAVRGGDVRPQRMAFGDFTVPQRGGWVTGVVVDGGGSNGPTEFSMENVRVGLYDADGRELATAVTDADGSFTLSGQLATQDGLTITVDPSSGGGWMKAAPPDNWCLFEGGEAYDASVTTGEESFYGPVYLPRSTSDAQTTACLS